MNCPRKVAYFGGTFDPVHCGHTAIVRAALDAGRTEEVWCAPAWVPPHKQGRHLAPFADRLAMLRLAIADIPGATATGIEAELALDPSYSVRVLAEVERRYPEIQVQLLIGADSLLDLYGWYHAEELVARYEILTYPRPDMRVDQEMLLRHWPEKTVAKLLSGVLPGKIYPISSCEVRKKLEKNENVDHIIDSRVWDYIRRRHLYDGGWIDGAKTGKL